MLNATETRCLEKAAGTLGKKLGSWRRPQSGWGFSRGGDHIPVGGRLQKGEAWGTAGRTTASMGKEERRGRQEGEHPSRTPGTGSFHPRMAAPDSPWTHVCAGWTTTPVMPR